MKPTRNIVKVNKGLWNIKHSVWYKHNDDEKPVKLVQEKADKNISKILNPNNKYKRQQEEILKDIFKDD